MFYFYHEHNLYRWLLPKQLVNFIQHVRFFSNFGHVCLAGTDKKTSKTILKFVQSFKKNLPIIQKPVNELVSTRSQYWHQKNWWSLHKELFESKIEDICYFLWFSYSVNFLDVLDDLIIFHLYYLKTWKTLMEECYF